jgi:hypothetical protein
MKTFTVITDPAYVKPLYETTPDRFFKKFIRDERDLPFMHLTFKLTITLLPLAVLLYLPLLHGWYWWLAASVYLFLNTITFKGPFSLMLHCAIHRTLFKKEYNFMNYYLPWILAPLFGHSPETYYSHHIGMHHVENNLEEDESSTMPYRRDSLRGFFVYFGIFFFSGVYRLAAYFFHKKRNSLLYRSVRGELLYILWAVGMSLINFKATMVVFLIPLLIYRFVAMLGNWSQHAFICPEDPGNLYKSCVTCINTKYNRKCWNDGYHISHHVKQNMHWTEHPAFFQKTMDKYITNNAIVFDGIHFLHVFFYLMSKRYDLLAKNFVNLGNRFKSDEEVIQLLKNRTRKIPFNKPSV